MPFDTEPAAPRSRASAPLSALGLVLAALALGGLAVGAPRDSAPVTGPHAGPPDAGPPPTQVPRILAEEPIALNSATEADLRLLPRIGPTLAARIVADRAENGCFAEVAELTRVRGIGPATLAQLAPLLSVDDGARCAAAP